MKSTKSGPVRLPMKEPAVHKFEHEPFLYGNIAKRDVIKIISRKAISSLTRHTTRKSQTGILLLQPGFTPHFQAQHHAVGTTPRPEEMTVSGFYPAHPATQSPGSVGLVPPIAINHRPANTSDDILAVVSGINTTRSAGIVKWQTNIRSLPGHGQGLTPVLLNGIHPDPTGRKTANRNTVYQDHIQRIEILKKPGSSRYGNNAMREAINIISKKAVPPFHLNASAFCGSLSAQQNRSGLSCKMSKTFLLHSGYYNQTDGNNPPSWIQREYDMGRRHSCDVNNPFNTRNMDTIIKISIHDYEILEINYMPVLQLHRFGELRTNRQG